MRVPPSPTPPAPTPAVLHLKPRPIPTTDLFSKRLKVGDKAPDFVLESSAGEKVALHDLLHGHARTLWRKRGFYRMLATMLFKAADPEERYRVLERFYRLDPGLIARFYAGQSTMFDRIRVLSGRPPVPIGRAVAALRGSR